MTTALTSSFPSNNDSWQLLQYTYTYKHTCSHTARAFSFYLFHHWRTQEFTEEDLLGHKKEKNPQLNLFTSNHMNELKASIIILFQLLIFLEMFCRIVSDIFLPSFSTLPITLQKLIKKHSQKHVTHHVVFTLIACSFNQKSSCMAIIKHLTADSSVKLQ